MGGLLYYTKLIESFNNNIAFLKIENSYFKNNFA